MTAGGRMKRPQPQTLIFIILLLRLRPQRLITCSGDGVAIACWPLFSSRDGLVVAAEEAGRAAISRDRPCIVRHACTVMCIDVFPSLELIYFHLFRLFLLSFV